MLSTTTSGLAPIELQAPPVNPLIGQINRGNGQFLAPRIDADGGFITTAAFNLDVQITGLFGRTAGVDSISLADLPNRGQVITMRLNGWSQLSGPTYDSNGIQPVVIVPNNLMEQHSRNERLVGGRGDRSLASNEGGAIPLHTLLTGLQRDDSLVPSNQAISPLTTAGPGESIRPSRLAAASEGVLSGELARAIVFEIAGGEPLRTTETQHGEENANDPNHGASQLNERTRPVDAGQRQASQPDMQTTPVAGRFSSADVIQDLSHGELVSGLSPSQPEMIGHDAAMHGAVDSNTAALASMAVFEQFSESRSAIVESSVEGDWWGRAAGATPLLMILALERIAAHNSRRSASVAPTQVSKKTLRSRDLAGKRREL